MIRRMFPRVLLALLLVLMAVVFLISLEIYLLRSASYLISMGRSELGYALMSTVFFLDLLPFIEVINFFDRRNSFLSSPPVVEESDS